MHPNSLKVVISIKESEDLCKKINNIYEFIGELEEKQNSETYNVDYSIIKANEHFSEKNVESDGFIYKHRLF
jgi:Asp-tRNA(Asn)/Glu-tRNA(Gln) amidotransferase C subunit